VALAGFTNLTSVDLRYVSGDFGAIDNLVLNNTTVPEPMTVAMVGLGLLGVSLTRRRKA